MEDYYINNNDDYIVIEEGFGTGRLVLSPEHKALVLSGKYEICGGGFYPDKEGGYIFQLKKIHKIIKRSYE